ncbi:MAG: homocysteine biosynthesis protein [Odoribacteraceae bacterium]|nr:homocysteine biosynthesis protein [Odoribacteraceae bacterium]
MKSFAEINDKIRSGKAVVLTAEEVTRMAKELSPAEIARRVDVVTTATFSATRSSGVFLNFGESDPPTRPERLELNGVRACAGLAVDDTFLGAAEGHPEKVGYGGAHVIEDLVAGKEVTLEAWGKATDDFPREHIRTRVSLESLNEAYLYNPRNASNDGEVAVNSSDQIIYTRAGVLLPRSRNAAYGGAGELSPLVNDPECRTIGPGTRVFLGGAVGYVAWNGTRFHDAGGTGEGRSLALVGDLRGMSTAFLRGVYHERFGVSLFVGVGVPVAVLDEDMARRVSIGNERVEAVIVDHGNGGKVLGTTNYAALQSGEIVINGQRVRSAPVASLAKAREVAATLKSWIAAGEFLLTEPTRPMPVAGALRRLEEKVD